MPVNASTPVGRDCTTIEGIDTVNCVAGACAVQACQPGWEMNDGGDGCVAIKPKRLLSRLFVDGEKPEEKSAVNLNEDFYENAYWAH